MEPAPTTADNADDTEELAWSVVIPAYNEEARIGSTLAAIHQYMERRGLEHEIIVVDDGSSDGTAALVARDFPEVRLLKNAVNLGKGAGVRTGLFAAQKPFVLFTDSDLSTPIEELERFEWEFSQGADMVIASRALPESKLELRQPWWRELSGRSFNTLVRLISGLPFMDTQCGFKAYRLEVAREIAKRQQLDGWAFDVEQLHLARLLGFRVRETPVRWINSPDTRVRFLKASLQMLGEVVRVRFRKYDMGTTSNKRSRQ
jgi:dolichyl-phosphate beta-glucosyltransferase